MVTAHFRPIRETPIFVAGPHLMDLVALPVAFAAASSLVFYAQALEKVFILHAEYLRVSVIQGRLMSKVGIV